MGRGGCGSTVVSQLRGRCPPSMLCLALLKVSVGPAACLAMSGSGGGLVRLSANAWGNPQHSSTLQKPSAHAICNAGHWVGATSCFTKIAFEMTIGRGSNIQEKVGIRSRGKRGTALSAASVDVDKEGAGVTSTKKDNPKRVLILMSDTGGGHRASAQALEAAFNQLYNGKIHTDIVDVWTEYARWPFNSAVSTYRFVARYPPIWKAMYDYARFPPTRRWAEMWANILCHKRFEKCFEKYDPDLVVSMHPLCHHVPHKVLRQMGEGKRQIPFATVVTDLGSAHPTWFDPRGDLVFVPSDVLSKKAVDRGFEPEKVRQFGLPVRPPFWKVSGSKERLQESLGLLKGVRTALIVGGGDGVGKLQDISKQVANRLAKDHNPAQVVVVCGKNQRMKDALEEHQWPPQESGVRVHIKGFVSNMDEWMSAADLLVTKAGPGTIAEACTRGLPLVLSSFLPGQEAGNVPYVTEGGLGLYRKRPSKIAAAVSELFGDPERLEAMGQRTLEMGRLDATKDIARELVTALLPQALGDAQPA